LPGGAHEILHDQFVRIKAIEALARMRVVESIAMLRQCVKNAMGWRYAEPSGVRTVAADAIALLEDRPTFSTGSAPLTSTPPCPGRICSAPAVR